MENKNKLTIEQITHILEKRFKIIEDKLEAQSKLLNEIKRIVTSKEKWKEQHSESPKEVSTVRLRNVKDACIKIKKLETLRQKAKEISQTNSKERQNNSIHNTIEETKLDDIAKFKDECSMIKFYESARNGRDILDRQINDIFNSTQPCEMKKEFIVEPIDLCTPSNNDVLAVEKIKLISPRKMCNLFQVLKSSKNSRNDMLDKLKTKISTMTRDATSFINSPYMDKNSSLDNVAKQHIKPLHVRAFKNNAPKINCQENRLSPTIRLTRIKDAKKGDEGNNGIIKETMPLEKLPGNSLELISEFIGSRSIILTLSKKVLIVYAQFRSQTIAKKISLHEQAKYGCDDDSSSGYETVYFLH